MPDLNTVVWPPDKYLFAALSDDGQNAVDVRALGATGDERESHLAVAAILYGRNGGAAAGSREEALLSQANNADNVATVAAGVLPVNAYQMLWDAAGGNWDRAQGSGGALIVTSGLVDDSAFGIATDRVFPSGALFDDVASDTVDEGDVGIFRMTANRLLMAVLADPTTPTQRQAVDSSGYASVGQLIKPAAAPPATCSTAQDNGSATTLNVKGTPGSVYAMRVANTNANKRYFQLHNTATTPGGGAAAQLWFAVPGGSVDQPGILELTQEFFAPAERFTTGIAWAWSTTATTYTAATAGDHQTQVRYV